jgi:hypothetical protein
MSLFEQIVSVYPELSNTDFDPFHGIILLKNDGDGKGDFIAKWDYEKPIPTGLKLGK